MSNKQYEIHYLVDKANNEEGQTYYLVKWKGYPHSENTWEPSSSIDYPGSKLIGNLNKRLEKRNKSKY